MEHLPLPVGGQGGGPDVCKTAVHVPFDIGHRRTGQYGFQLAVDVVADLLAGEIQHQLTPAPGLGAVGLAQSPVRMGPEEVAVFADHLRLNP